MIRRFVDWWLMRRGYVAMPESDLNKMRAKALQEKEELIALLERALYDLEYVQARTPQAFEHIPRDSGLPQVVYDIHDIREAVK